MGSEFCKCGAPRREGQRDCRECHARSMREFRERTPLNEEQRAKMNCRSYANTYKRRGKLIQEPCPCGSPDSQMHHHDYTKPLEVEWLCRKCHLARHRELGG